MNHDAVVFVVGGEATGAARGGEMLRPEVREMMEEKMTAAAE